MNNTEKIIDDWTSALTGRYYTEMLSIEKIKSASDKLEITDNLVKRDIEILKKKILEAQKQALEENKLNEVNTAQSFKGYSQIYVDNLRKQTAEEIFKDLGKIVIDVHIDYNLQFDRKSFEELKEKYLGENSVPEKPVQNHSQETDLPSSEDHIAKQGLASEKEESRPDTNNKVWFAPYKKEVRKGCGADIGFDTKYYVTHICGRGNLLCPRCQEKTQ